MPSTSASFFTFTIGAQTWSHTAYGHTNHRLNPVISDLYTILVFMCVAAIAI